MDIHGVAPLGVEPGVVYGIDGAAKAMARRSPIEQF